MANKSRPIRLTVRVNETEKEIIDKKIVAAGGNQQKFLLKCILDKDIMTKPDFEVLLAIYKELQSQGKNLNQVSHNLNSYVLKNENMDKDISEQITSCDQSLRKLVELWQFLKPFLQEHLLEEQSNILTTQKKQETENSVKEEDANPTMN